MTDAYRTFLEEKVALAPKRGLDLRPSEINPLLKPHTQAMARWAVQGGRRAIFASFGLHKTSTQIEIVKQIKKLVGGHGLITLPLGVRQEFFADAERFFRDEHAVKLKFIRSDAEVGSEEFIYLTNYESVRDGKLDPRQFNVSSLDEAAVLRGMGGTKTFREFMRLFEHVPYRFVATATPDPNEYVELLSYAAYLGIMDIGEGKTRFFRRDSEHADKLTLHPHKAKEFWLWVASWALFVQRPSDIGYDDTGYDLPPLDIRWHEIAADHHDAGQERDGQYRLLKQDAVGVTQAASEKRGSLDARIVKMMEIRAEDPEAHRLIWHDLEDERRAIEKAAPEVVTVYGSQDLDKREEAIIGFRDGTIAEMAGKPVMLGSGCNFQHHCAWEIFLGIGFKFSDFIQAIFRCQRFGQSKTVRIDLIYTEAERGVRRRLEEKWGRYKEQCETMSALIKEYGLAEAAIAQAMQRSIGTERAEVCGEHYRLIKNDCVVETAAMPADSVDLIASSIPFGSQYQYSASYNDFGHVDDNDHFWRQMDFLTVELLRVLKPGRVAAIHVKDRIVPGGLLGLGFQTLNPFSDECVAHFRKHGFAFLARKTITTDVVRENNQTYRLGWTEQCKDGSRMGCGVPEYLLLFRKPPTDASDGYADNPVLKPKREWKGSSWRNIAHKEGLPIPAGEGYSRGRWQLDAHGYTRSSGDRFLAPEEVAGLEADQVYKLFKSRNLAHVYNFEDHVTIAEALEERGALPPTFMLLPPHSWHPDVWSDIARMRTLNMIQASKGKEMHLCPLQLDIVDRVIAQFTNPGEIVYDPFAGLGTVPYCAVKLGRRGLGCELNADYFADSVFHLRAAEKGVSVPTLFDLTPKDAEEAA